MKLILHHRPLFLLSQGVGSHAAHLLLRSGVGRLRLVDFDQVTLSSLNRHCLATRRDVGLSKSEVLARHFREIMPEAQVEDMRCMYTPESEEDVLSGPVDFVLDAIDNIDTKVRQGGRRLGGGWGGLHERAARMRRNSTWSIHA